MVDSGLEVWREVGIAAYAISSFGNVRNGDRIKKPSRSGNGYLIVGLFDSGKRVNALVHRLVAAAFIGPCPLKHEVNHRDGNKLNNVPANLEYVTRSGNALHAIANGLSIPPALRPGWEPLRGDSHHSRTHPERLARGDKNGSRVHPERLARGESQHMAKLTEEDVRSIRELFASGLSGPKIAARFGVSHENVYLIVKRLAWKHVA